MEKIQNTLSQLLSSNLVKIPLATIGAGCVLGKCYSALNGAYRHFLRSPIDLQRRYGKQSWAIVTGAGQGIGEQWAIQLAQYKFNIACVGRGQNVEDLANKIKKEYNVKTLSIRTDLSQPEVATRQIQQSVQGLDVSILVNNAGVIQKKQIEDMLPQEVMDLINVNCQTPTRLIQAFVPQFKNRQNRSAIINVSSFAPIVCCGYMTTYAASKGYITSFGKALATELKDKIDVLTLAPSYVATRMISNLNPDIFVATAEQCVKGALKELGRGEFTFGSWKHALKYNTRSISTIKKAATEANKKIALS